MRTKSPHAILWGHRIATTRKALRRPQQWLADQLNVHQATVCNWEKGWQAPSDIYRGPLARVLGVDPGWLFSYDDANGDEAAA